VSPARVPGLLLRGLLLAMGLSVPAWLALQHFAVVEPYIYPLHTMQAPAVQSGPNLLFGPYPDHAELARLKAAGYLSVVSLLSPAIVYEGSLLERERRDAGSLGLTFRNLPMNSSEPTTSPGNAAALHELQQLLARSPGTRVYVHCYLGKHRSRMAADWLAKHGVVPAK
jgi:rhodanese-related sulfurtransferase